MDTNFDRTWTRHPTSTGIGVDRGSVCAHCGLRSPPGSAQGALLPDATVIDPQDRGHDGRRYVTASGTEHLQVLIDRAPPRLGGRTTVARNAVSSQQPTSDARRPGGGPGPAGPPVPRTPAPRGGLEHPQQQPSGHAARRPATDQPTRPRLDAALTQLSPAHNPLESRSSNNSGAHTRYLPNAAARPISPSAPLESGRPARRPARSGRSHSTETLTLRELGQHRRPHLRAVRSFHPHPASTVTKYISTVT